MILVWLTIVGTLAGVTYYSGRTMDRVAIENQRALIDNAITSRLSQGLSEMRSIAWWNDMVTNTDPAHFDRDWLDLEVGSYMVETFNHKRIYILSEDNRPVYAFGAPEGLQSTHVATDMAAFAPLIRQARGGPDVSPRVKPAGRHTEIYEYIGSSSRKFSRAFGAVVEVEGKPALAMAMLITPSVDTDKHPPLRRLVLSLISLDQAALAKFGQGTLMGDLGFRQTRTEMAGTFDLRTDDGRPMATLYWSPKRPGNDMLQRLIPWIVGAIALATLIFLLLVRQLFASNQALAARESQSRFLADHDVLTGLPNRRHLENLYNQHINDPDENANRLIVACIDFDRFKDINDTLGHHAGDTLIRAVALRLRSMLQEGDTLARLGGDEFAVLRSVPWANDGTALATVIARCFDSSFEVSGHEIETTASVGLYFAGPRDAFADAMRRADIALYDAKAQLRGGASRFNEEMARKVEERHAIQVDLKRAIAAQELTVAYQPIVAAATGAISSVEALVRWNSPAHGQVSPDVFISIAEEAGLMADLGRFVICQAMSDARRWPELSTAINISPAQLRSATIVADLLEPSRRFGVSPTKITIEITESVLMANDDRTLRVLRELKEHGFTLALDDFGTGYSSLAYIRDFPFDRLKIDRSFVKGLSVNDRSLPVVEAVVNIGRILGREIVAEGIETEQEMQAMQQAGCTHLQGFLFSRALPADHIEALAATFGRLVSRQGGQIAVPGSRAAKILRLPNRRKGRAS